MNDMSMINIKNTLKHIRSFFLNPDLWVWAYPLLLVIPNVALLFTEYNPVLWMLSSVLVAMGIWLLIMGLWKRTGITLLCFLPVAVLCAFQLVLLFLYGNGIIAIDMFLNVVTTNAAEVSELLGNLQVAILVVVLLYLPPLALGVYFIVKRRFASARTLRLSRLAGGVSVLCGVGLALGGWATSGAVHAERYYFPYNVTENLCTAVERFQRSGDYKSTSKGFMYHAHSERPDCVPEVYVFVVGETARADNWNLFGYERETTPLLDKRNGLVGFPKTLSEINTTHKSVPMLISPLTAETFNDSVDYVKSIFAAFNEAGYKTAFISNQRRNHSYIDFFGEEAQTVKFLTDEGKVHPDMHLVDGLRKAVKNAAGKKLFVILHSYGSHFEYNKRYPREYAVFKSDRNSEAEVDNRSQLINAYDNTMRYTDAVLDGVIGVLDSLNVPAAMAYVSDHGEDIFDDERERFLHASPVPTYWQLHVPMFVWMSDELDARYPEMKAAARKNAGKQVSSSRSVFHTMLQLAGVRTPYFKEEGSLVSERYSEPRPLYLNDYNESLPLDMSGLRPMDYEKLKAGGMRYR